MKSIKGVLMKKAFCFWAFALFGLFFGVFLAKAQIEAGISEPPKKKDKCTGHAEDTGCPSSAIPATCNLTGQVQSMKCKGKWFVCESKTKYVAGGSIQDKLKGASANCPDGRDYECITDQVVKYYNKDFTEVLYVRYICKPKQLDGVHNCGTFDEVSAVECETVP